MKNGFLFLGLINNMLYLKIVFLKNNIFIGVFGGFKNEFIK